MTETLNILRIDASGRRFDSHTRRLADELIDAMRSRFGELAVTWRDLADGVEFIDEAWIGANVTPEAERTGAERRRLATSDELIAELETADILVIGVPVYNFGIPAALKAWIDMIARARKTFRYAKDGPVGLLTGKTAYLVVASGGVEVDGPADFATPYLRQVLGFIGINNVQVIAADGLKTRGEEALRSARRSITEAIETTLSGARMTLRAG